MQDKELDSRFYPIILIKPNQEWEKVYYKKESEKFQGDYAIVKAYSKELKYANHVWYGIINRNYQTVLPFKLWNKIERIENNFFVEDNSYQKTNPFPHRRTYHYTLNQNHLNLVKVMGNYQKITSQVLCIENENHLFQLYDLKKQQVLSNSFSSFSTEIKENKIVLYATRELVLPPIFLKQIELSCYIDLDGNMISPVYNPIGNKLEYLTKENFESYYQKTIETIKQSFQSKSDIEIKKILIKEKK